MARKFAFTILIVLIASVFFDIILNEFSINVPDSMTLFKVLILIVISILSLLIKELKPLSKFAIIVTSIIIVQLITSAISSSSFWKNAFDQTTFVGNFGGSIVLKVIGVIPILAILFLLLGSPNEFYLGKGDLSVKASKINWLGIKENSISWKKLSIISAVLISFGTILLTVFTATDSTRNKDILQLLKYMPIITLMAFINSMCEGIVFRSAVLGTLKNALSKKYVILVACLFFGIGHYYGAPSGIVGVVMASLLGWYMCRSMYETKGFVSSWIIHFFQDVVIFSTIYIMS
ncbi:MAG: CPBP family intramembrane glutamic endopeptidase [Mobilitalea sp.]